MSTGRVRQILGQAARREEPAEASAPAPPLERRLRGPIHPMPTPLAVLRVVLGAARSAGFPFEAAWSLAGEAALSYMDDADAEGWWTAIDGTRAAWADAYNRPQRRTRLRELHGDL